MIRDAYRIVKNSLRPLVPALFGAAALALVGCLGEDPGRPQGGGISVDPLDKDLPVLLSVDYQSPNIPDRFLPEEKRIRYVAVDARMAEDAGSLLSSSRRFVFNLFDDVRLVAETEKVDIQEAGRFTLRGRLAGAEGSWFLLTCYDGAVSATVHHPLLGEFVIEPNGVGTGRLTEFDPKRLPGLRHGMLYPDGDVHVHDGTAHPMPLAKPATAAAPAVLDIMVLYTAAAATGAGGAATMQSKIRQAVEEVTNAFTRSQINASFNLVHAAQVNYAESGNMGTDLGRLQKTADGFLDEVHALRTTHKADFVSLVVEQSGGIAGIAYVMTNVSTSFKGWAFSVVGRRYTGAYTTMAHELGHNLGCAHDRQNSTSQAAYPYSYGHRFYGTNGVQYRDIMAYSPGSQIPYFSNPNILYQGTPTGVPDGQPNSADNARTINNTSPVAQSFLLRDIVPPDPGGVPAGWTTQDIGTVGAAGSFTASNGVFSVSGSGGDIWNNADAFRYGWQTMDGDGSITARVVSVQNTNVWAKAGVMIRETTGAGSRHASTLVTPASGIAFQRRTATAGVSTHTGTAGSAPRWVRLVRAGTMLRSYHSADGITWTLIGEVSMTLPQMMQVGLAVTSHVQGTLCTASFDNVTVVK